MSKYNRMKTIPYNTIPESEKKKAVKEWAEGNDNMEKLIWACINNGIETTGCHSGAEPYLSIRLNDAHDKVRRMLRVVQEIDGMQILVSPDGGNPFGGSDWDKPSILFSFMSTTDKKSADAIFDRMRESLITKNTGNEPKSEAFAHMLDFYDFFTGKESELHFRMIYTSGQYKFSVEPYKNNRNLHYITNLLKRAGLKQAKERKDIPIEEWDITASTLDEFNNKMIKCKDVITEEWNLEPPHEITEGMTFNEIARIKRREFGDTQQGQQHFKEWLQNEYDKMIRHSEIMQRRFEKERNKSVWDRTKNKVMDFLRKLKKKNRILELPQSDKSIEPSNERRSFESRISNNGDCKENNPIVTKITIDTQTMKQLSQKEQVQKDERE